MDDQEVPTSYNELLVKYQQLLQENVALRNLNQLSLKDGKPDSEEPTAPTIPSSPSSESRTEIEVVVPHPFLQEPILRHLSTFVTHEGLRASRQVCSHWYIFMTPAFLKKSKIVAHFSSNPNARNLLRGADAQPGGGGNIPAEEIWILDSSDSDDEADGGGWRTLENFSRVYPHPHFTEEELANPIPKDTSTFQGLRKFYWESKASIIVDAQKITSSNIGGSAGNNYQYLVVPSSPSTEEERSTTDSAASLPISLPPIPQSSFNLGLNLDNDFYIPPPPVPETLQLIGFTCPNGWLRTYGYLIKRLCIDFGNFQRRERFGDVEPKEVVRLLQDFCPNVEFLRMQKPNYNLDGSNNRLNIQNQGPPSQNLQLPTFNPMATAHFNNISTLELITYRSDRVGCVKELIGSTPNVRHLTLTMFSVAPEVETQYLDAAHNSGGYLEKLETLKFPLGIKSTTLVFLASLDFSQLKKLVLGRIRQTRWVRGLNQPQGQGQLMAFVDPATLSEFLQNVSGTLEDLSLTVNLTHPDEIGVGLTSADIPVMPYLHRLEYKYARPEFTESFAFLENLPTLNEIDLTGDFQANNTNEMIIQKLLPENFYIQNETLTQLKLNHIPVDFPSVVKIVRNFQQLRVVHLLLPLNSNDTGNSNVRRPLSRYLFKLRKLSRLEEISIKCSVVERDDFGYSVGFCLRYMRALKKFSFQSLKTLPRLTTFAVDMGFGKAPSLLSVELEDFIIHQEDKAAIEASLKKKLLHTKFINCFVVNPLKNSTPPNSRAQERTSFRDEIESTEKWSFEMDKYTDFASLGKPSNDPDDQRSSTLSFSTSDTESLEFAIASF